MDDYTIEVALGVWGFAAAEALELREKINETPKRT